MKRYLTDGSVTEELITEHRVDQRTTKVVPRQTRLLVLNSVAHRRTGYLPGLSEEAGEPVILPVNKLSFSPRGRNPHLFPNA